ncbi:hypothetical protein N7530_008817 [Penicillium desertorum]|uniref:Uncharacterized protein n=1 Tax=Penicillium desertorum TaxID=1303715 RepID=A0A9W9WPT2_9EURO|nr:hypothetical protein N7530_008817 [Penicillium desertorum]
MTDFPIEHLHEIAIGRTHDLKDRSKAVALEDLVGGLSSEQLREVRKAYVDRYYVDPEHHFRNFDVYQESPSLRLDPDLLIDLLGILNRADITGDVTYLSQLLKKSKNGNLTLQDRKEYYSWLPRIGLWDAPARKPPGNKNVDSYERRLRCQAWERISDADFDETLKEIEREFPTMPVQLGSPKKKTVAVIASSHGAQWQEIIDWALGMMDAGYTLQVFTPFGRPVALQRDSILVREPPTEAIAVSLGLPGVGLGCPLRLDPLRLPQQRLDHLLGHAVGADQFDPKQFGAVYLAGGLGFNEDVAITTPNSAVDDTHAKIAASPDVARMMEFAVQHRLPIIALCHGPTLLACLDIEINGKREKLVKGIEVAALPALEPLVHAQGKLEPQFSFYTWKTHDVLAQAGAIVDEQTDLQDMTITYPHPAKVVAGVDTDSLELTSAIFDSLFSAVKRANFSAVTAAENFSMRDIVKFGLIALGYAMHPQHYSSAEDLPFWPWIDTILLDVNRQVNSVKIVTAGLEILAQLNGPKAWAGQLSSTAAIERERYFGIIPDIASDTILLSNISFFTACSAICYHLDFPPDDLMKDEAISPFILRQERPTHWHRSDQQRRTEFATNSSTTPYSHILSQHMKPTVEQVTIPHHPYLDIIPWPSFRARAIVAASMNPPLIDEADLCLDLFNNGIHCWGTKGTSLHGRGEGTPWDFRSWEAKPWFLQKWAALTGAHDVQQTSSWWRLHAFHRAESTSPL